MKVDALLNGIGCLTVSGGLTLALYLSLLSSSSSPDNDPEFSPVSTDFPASSPAMDDKTAMILFVILIIGLCVPCCFVAGVLMTYSAVWDDSLARRTVAAWTCAFVADTVTGNEKDLQLLREDSKKV